MHTTELLLSSIRPYEFNNRNHPEKQINLIAKSIKEYGFNQPLVLDENNTILVGHGRYYAAIKLKLDKVPVIVKKDLTEKQKKAYRILDNKLQNDSSWEFNNLELELGWLEDNEFNLEEWGLEDLKELYPEEDIETSEDDFDPTPKEEPFIKLGDLIELSRHKLLCGDATETNELLEATLDMVITDPPYGVSYTGKTKDALKLENDNLKEADLLELWQNTLDNIIPALKDGGAIYASVPAGRLRSVFSEELKKREILRQELVWLKDSMVLGHSDYHYKHEPILYGWKPGDAHYITSDRSKTSVLEHDRPKRSTEHPTMKPVSLWAELIKNSSRRDEIIYDPFLGSGTTIIAADQLGRICYGTEIDPRYCQVILERYKKYCLDNNKEFICKINGIPYEG